MKRTRPKVHLIIRNNHPAGKRSLINSCPIPISNLDLNWLVISDIHGKTRLVIMMAPETEQVARTKQSVTYKSYFHRWQCKYFLSIN